MKRTAINHTKMRKLMRLLDVPQYAAVGILESLWALTARETPAGNIGKLLDVDIAATLDWRNDERRLTDGLVDAGWVDRDTGHRLIIHDWHEHSDDAVDNQLARSGQRYASGQMPRMKRLSAKEREAIVAEHFADTSVRTESHEKPLPEPEPEPEPVPATPLPPSQAMGECVASEADADEDLDEQAGQDEMAAEPRGVVLAMPRLERDAGGVPRELMLGERSACAAVQRVMRECDWSDRRLAPVIEKALRQHREKEGGDLVASAELMISMQRSFVQYAHLFRYAIGPRKFIMHGHWITDALWPYDNEKLKQARRL